MFCNVARCQGLCGLRRTDEIEGLMRPGTVRAQPQGLQDGLLRGAVWALEPVIAQEELLGSAVHPRRGILGQEVRTFIDILHDRRRSHVVGTRSSRRVVSGASESGQGTEKFRLSPEPSTEQVRQRFSRQRRTGTAPELALRRELHRRGWRYRVNLAPLQDLRRRRADIVFTRLRVAVFVDGCFWHACPQHATAPKANADWWRAKLEANVARDRDTDARLSERGWAVVRVWEHEPATEATDRVELILVARKAQLSGST